MSCYYPVVVPRKGYVDLRQEVACGRCIGCRLSYRRDWAIRCVHEAQSHDRKCFLTLTYRRDNLPEGGSLRPDDLRLFIRRLRREVAPVKVRFFACGEYGEDFSRPHYHVLLFGWDFPDRVVFEKGGPHKVWTSGSLDRLWSHGFAQIGSLNYETAYYTAGYVMKKVTGEVAGAHYGNRHAEFVRMSRMPGIGSEWYERFGSEVFPDDFVVARGKQHPVPRFYLKRLKSDKPLLAEDVLKRRVKKARLRGFDNTPQRLAVREAVAAGRFKLSRRNLE